MTAREELAYVDGQRAVWRRMLSYALTELHYPSTDITPQVAMARVAVVLEDTEQQLRRLADELGVAWPEGLHLADVVEKHIAPAVRRALATGAGG